MSLVFRTLLVICLVSIIDCYKILVVFGVPSQSHKTLGKGFVRELLNDGHEVIFATPYPEKNPVKNLRYIDLSKASEMKQINMLDQDSESMSLSLIKEISFNMTRMAVLAPDMQQVLKNEKVDAVISEWFFTDLDAGYAAVLQCPRIVVSGMTMHPGIEYLVDSVQSPAVVPMMMNDFAVPMPFLERVKNTFFVSMMTLSTHFLDLPATERTYREIFTPIAEARGVVLPDFYEAVHNISTLFVNSHPSLGYAQSLPPNTVEIGGYHIDPKLPALPEDLKSILDNSNGVVYFSMGSVLKSALMPQKTKEDLLNVFKDLPYTVLWKFEEKLENVPKNVIIRPWMPQPSILAHPKVKVFITHGGLLSSLEAIKFGMPILAVPVFGDQPSNAARAVRKGYALSVPYAPDMAPELKDKLNQMLQDDRYSKKAKEISYLFNTRPVLSGDLIKHYVKLSIETKGAHHLRSTSLQYTWFQRLLVDQILVLLLIIITLYFIIRKLCCTTTSKDKKKVKKN